ncbi:MAG: L-threonylcarbamoyladenylate synthase [Candidatus Saccharibacteria bacterium]
MDEATDIFKHVSSWLAQPGAIGVIPTDTVYGVVARAADSVAVQRLYALKQRQAKPGTLIAASLDQLESLGFKRRYLTAVSQFWPGAVSVVIPGGPDLAALHQGTHSLAVRLPAEPKLRALLAATGPLLTSSANQAGAPLSVTSQQAQTYFGDKVDFYVDGGDLSGQQPSTIIRIVDDEIEILRHGAVNINDQGEILE